MSLYKRPDSPYWQIEIEIAGITVKRSSRTRDKHAAEELEKQLRDNLWRQVELGEQRYTWNDAVTKFALEHSGTRSWERTQRCIDVLNEYFDGEYLDDITYDAILTTRSLLELRVCRGHNWKTERTWKHSTCDRVLAVLSSVLHRCASDDWKMLIRAPKVLLFADPEGERRWVSREQAIVLLERFPSHTCDMSIFALATGLRRSNVTHLEWSRVDMVRRCCYVPGYLSKSGEPIPIPLNDDAMGVLERWAGKHERYVFVYRQRAPIQQVTTKMWRRECKAVGLEGVTFHTLRHSWASWQTQSGTPPRFLQELGGWKSLQMPQKYSHLDPGHLTQFANRTLLRPDSPTVDAETSETNASDCFGGEGGTRTLDPGIMRTGLKKKA